MQDGVFKSEVVFQKHEDKMYHKLTQPSEDIILNRNRELRKNQGAINDFGKGTQTWGRMVASIPLNMFEKAKRDGYDLESKDAEIAQRELNRYLQSTEGKMCLVQGK